MLLMDIFGIKSGVMALLLTLDGIVYNFICGFYDIFLALTRLNLFSNEDYQTIVQRIYIIIGIVMLFTLSYSLLRAVINPDEYSKGDKSALNIVKNIIISLVIIVVLPTVFDVAYRVQAVILNSDVIGKLILNQDVGKNAIRDGGNTIAVNVFRAFFQVNPDAETGDYSGDYVGVQTAVAGAFDEVSRGGSFYVFNGKYDFNGTEYNFPKLVADNVINYSYIISTIAGGFVLWCILLFCFDLGIRAIKLIFYQMIAPVAVVCRVIPGSKTKDVFNNWLKLVVATFLEVFIRVFVMYLGVYLITLLVTKFPDVAAAGNDMGLGKFQRVLLKAFLIMGLIAFIRQAPKLIQDVFGFDTKGMSLGLKGLTERIGAGGGYAAKNLVTNSAKGLTRRGRRAVQNFKETKGQGVGKRALTATRGVFSTFGGLGAGFSSFASGFNAKNGKEAKEASDKAINNMMEKQEQKDKYWAKHGGTVGGVIKGKAEDAFNAFMGVDVAAYDRVIKATGEVSQANDAFRSELKKVFEKHKTDAAILTKMKEGDFKGSPMLYQLYQEYQGQSVATIEQDIERQRKEVQSRGIDYYYEDAKRKVINEMMATGASREDIEHGLSIDDSIVKEEAQKYLLQDSNRIAMLDSMIAQMTKFQITKLGEVAFDGTSGIGSIKQDELYTAKNLGENALETMKNAGMKFVDPDPTVTDMSKKNPTRTPGNTAKYIDDVASVAGKMSSDASFKKQKIIQKQKDK